MISNEAERLTQRLKTQNFRQQLVTAFQTAQGKMTDKDLTRENFPANVSYKAHWIDHHLVAEVSSLSVQRNASILMLHGGGFVIPAGKNFVTVGMAFVQAGYTVWFADYPLIQNYSSDYLRKWLLRAYEKMAEQTDRSLLFGDSAGANLALRLLLDIRDKGLPQPHATELFSLGPDLTLATTDLKQVAESDVVLDRDGLASVFSDVFDADMNRYYSFNAENDYSQLGNIRLDMGGNELFVPDVLALMDVLDTVGTSPELMIHPAMMHDFIMWSQLPESQAVQASILNYFNEGQK
ncbi:alpha/beta hydrolase [Weissella tructae]|uniref:Alpha/beta hydrolase n=2 Tax=Weissella TaxID=46255 RepID=A0A075U063_9LACO|nr:MULTISPECIES: alpha/beta hydrolase [Weissella]AIG65593.1 alpha/beta hydrolase [Weissella tructae]AIM62908.1 alpha/beta hydrolase [Weissella ceti]AIM64306.1 alpha/beta hydrolase [Weissella ceti]ELA06950.1 alpha/beta hydrolase [Weissella ceti NC36]QVV90722.1 alpha/beta hydrolase [Weissella tructae]